MKLSVITDEIADDLQTALQVAREFGIDRVELRTLWGVNIVQADEATQRRAKSLLQEYGMGVCCAGDACF
jgi:dissimilatory sulfite reductase (desulfoviridin) alpha/beta subunit